NWNPTTQQGAQYGGIHTESASRTFSFNGLYSLGYSNTFNDKHNLSVTAYMEYYKAHSNGLSFQQRGLDPRFVGVGAAFIPGTTIDVNTEEREYIPTVGSSNVTAGMLSYFANAMYDFDQKYALTATIRRDGTF